MLLDTYDTLFLWIGNKSNAEERKKAMESAEIYLSEHPSDRDTETPIVVVKQGYEPLIFTGFFGSWDPKLWAQLEKFQDIKNDIVNQGKSSALKILSGNNCSPDFGANFDTSAKYPINILNVKDPMELPEGVNPSKKEVCFNNCILKNNSSNFYYFLLCFFVHGTESCFYILFFLSFVIFVHKHVCNFFQ